MTDYTLPIEVPGLKYYKIHERFELEAGGSLEGITIAYHSYGTLNAKKDNVIWVCHALTANSDPTDWWSGLFGSGKLFDPDKHFIVCANILGSCYGSTGPRSIDRSTGRPYGLDFPLVSIRDQVKAHALLSKHLGIKEIEIAIGGSCGGNQVLEMCLNPDLLINKAILLVSSAKESAWSIAVHEAQRMTLKASQDFFGNANSSGAKALEAARAIGMINYRTYQQFINTQTDTENSFTELKASSYMRYQGKKLRNRFYAHCYFSLLNSLDTHDIGRNRGGIEPALSRIESSVLTISIDSDILIPVAEQKKISKHITDSTHKVISSNYGHDGFLIEAQKIEDEIRAFLSIDSIVNSKVKHYVF